MAEAPGSPGGSWRSVCTYAPRELVEALGIEAPRLVPPGTVASESRGEARSGAGTCSWCKSALGADDLTGLWIGGATCDQMRRCLELAGRASGIKPLIIHVPKTRTEAAESYYRDELRWLAGELEKRTGRRLEEAALRAAIMIRNEIRARIRRTRLNLSGADFTALIHLEAGLSAPEMLALLKERVFPRSRTSGIPVLIAGSPVTPAEERWLDLLESSGMSVVADATCTGDRAVDFEISVEGEDDLIPALAQAYFRRPPCLFVRPNLEFYEYARRLARERGARAVVWRSVRSCDIHALEAPRAERILGLPFLAVDMSYGDIDSVRVRTRLEALAESLR